MNEWNEKRTCSFPFQILLRISFSFSSSSSLSLSLSLHLFFSLFLFHFDDVNYHTIQSLPADISDVLRCCGFFSACNPCSVHAGDDLNLCWISIEYRLNIDVKTVPSSWLESYLSSIWGSCWDAFGFLVTRWIYNSRRVAWQMEKFKIRFCRLTYGYAIAVRIIPAVINFCFKTRRRFLRISCRMTHACCRAHSICDVRISSAEKFL